MTEICDIYTNVLNITNHCEVDVMGIDIKTPCNFLCVLSLQYAIHSCKYIYGKSNLLEKIINLLKLCDKPIVKEKIIQIVNN